VELFACGYEWLWVMFWGCFGDVLGGFFYSKKKKKSFDSDFILGNNFRMFELFWGELESISGIFDKS